ncbi:MAG: phosphate/phosphite/phosphonate ABC transporter substrate-binding protein [Chloroflexaceae bacterium]|nr:phosphate/phosphite/phosphonate ABC transporter substrate-binding protein [Chloroflexaceae bacterium]
MSSVMMKVCPHDTIREPERWTELAMYLNAATGTELTFDISIDFPDFQDNLGRSGLVYANPSDTLDLVNNHQFTVLARPAGRFDEAVLVCNTEQEAVLAGINGKPLATVVSLMPTKIALQMLGKQGIAPSELHNVDLWQAVIGCIWRGECQYGIVYKDTYNGLSEQSKGMVKLLATTDEQVAFHSILVGPALAAQADALRAALREMPNDPTGKALMERLAITRWEPVSETELATMQALANG